MAGKAKEPKKKLDHHFHSWFSSADKDHNGFLSPKELEKALKKEGYKMASKQMKALFKEMDKNGDGRISFEEYMFHMGQVPEIEHHEVLLRKAFQEADTNGDGVLDIQEITEIIRSVGVQNPKEMFDVIYQMDKDRNGSIDYNEFVTYFLQRSGINL